MQSFKFSVQVHKLHRLFQNKNHIISFDDQASTLKLSRCDKELKRTQRMRTLKTERIKLFFPAFFLSPSSYLNF